MTKPSRSELGDFLRSRRDIENMRAYEKQSKSKDLEHGEANYPMGGFYNEDVESLW